MGEIISMKYDFLFKEVMSDKKILRLFLSDVLDIPAEEILQITYQNPFLRKRRRQEKQGILDLIVEFNNQTKVNIELQIKWHLRWDKRDLFYLARMYADDLRSGEKYDKLKKCICISILDFNYTNREKYHTVYRLRDSEGNEFSDLFEVHTIELGKKLNGNKLDDWIRLFNATTEGELKMIASKNVGVQMAAMKIRKLSLTQKIRILYEAHMKEIRDRKWFADGTREEGRLEGIIEVYQEIGMSRSGVVLKIADRFQLPEEQARQIVEKYWKK